MEWDVRKYYCKLYRRREDVIGKEDILDMTGPIKKISALDKETLEGELTLEEVSKTLMNTHNNVPPGASGFTGAFYKVFWCFMKKVVLGAMHEIFENKELPTTVRLGLIALISKGNTDRRYISNWRPLMLLEALYKLLSTTLASRLKPVLDKIVGDEQKAYVQGRFISECTCNTSVLFTHAKENNLTGMMMLIDFEKAFDSVSFEFIMNTLDLFDFWGNFKTWISIILGMEPGNNFNAVTVINGDISKPFVGKEILFWVIFFILAIEKLALILKNSKIKPYRTKGGLCHLFDIYADDLTIYLQRKGNNKKKNLENISEALRIIELFFCEVGSQS